MLASAESGLRRACRQGESQVDGQPSPVDDLSSFLAFLLGISLSWPSLYFNTALISTVTNT